MAELKETWTRHGNDVVSGNMAGLMGDFTPAGMTKAMAIDLAPNGIRVNTIGPTFIDTPLTKPFWSDKVFHDDVVRRIKLGRLGKVEDLMGAVVYLASDAAALVTGTSLVVDGGWTAE